MIDVDTTTKGLINSQWGKNQLLNGIYIHVHTNPKTQDNQVKMYVTWAWQGQKSKQHCIVRLKKIVDKMNELNTDFVK